MNDKITPIFRIAKNKNVIIPFGDSMKEELESFIQPFRGAHIDIKVFRQIIRSFLHNSSLSSYAISDVEGMLSMFSFAVEDSDDLAIVANLEFVLCVLDLSPNTESRVFESVINHIIIPSLEIDNRTVNEMACDIIRFHSVCNEEWRCISSFLERCNSILVGLSTCEVDSKPAIYVIFNIGSCLSTWIEVWLKQSASAYSYQASQALFNMMNAIVFTASTIIRNEVINQLFPPLLMLLRVLKQTQEEDRIISQVFGMIESLRNRKAEEYLTLSLYLQNLYYKYYGDDMHMDYCLQNCIASMKDDSFGTRKYGADLLNSLLSYSCQHLCNYINSETEDYMKIKNALESEWELYISVYETLDEYAVHLVKEIWGRIATLTGKSPSLASLKHTVPVVNSQWIEVLYKKAITHPNPQVRMYVMNYFFSQTLLSEDFLPSIEFLTDCVIPSLNDSVFYKGDRYGIGYVMSSFFLKYSEHLGDEDRVKFVKTLFTRIPVHIWNPTAIQFTLSGFDNSILPLAPRMLGDETNSIYGGSDIVTKEMIDYVEGKEYSVHCPFDESMIDTILVFMEAIPLRVNFISLQWKLYRTLLHITLHYFKPIHKEKLIKVLYLVFSFPKSLLDQEESAIADWFDHICKSALSWDLIETVMQNYISGLPGDETIISKSVSYLIWRSFQQLRDPDHFLTAFSRILYSVIEGSNVDRKERLLLLLHSLYTEYSYLHVDDNTMFLFLSQLEEPAVSAVTVYCFTQFNHYLANEPHDKGDVNRKYVLCGVECLCVMDQQIMQQLVELLKKWWNGNPLEGKGWYYGIRMIATAILDWKEMKELVGKGDIKRILEGMEIMKKSKELCKEEKSDGIYKSWCLLCKLYEEHADLTNNWSETILPHIIEALDSCTDDTLHPILQTIFLTADASPSVPQSQEVYLALFSALSTVYRSMKSSSSQVSLFIHTLLHPFFFSLSFLHSNDHPFHILIHLIVQDITNGMQSWTIPFVSAFIASLLHCSEWMSAYWEEIVDLLMFKENEEDMNIQRVHPENYGRVIVLCELDRLNELQKQQPEVRSALEKMMVYLININFDKKLERYVQNSEDNGVKLRSWQALCCLSKYLPIIPRNSLLEAYKSVILQLNLRDVRQYVECFGYSLFMLEFEQLDAVLLDLLRNYNQQQQCVPSILLVCYYVLRDQPHTELWYKDMQEIVLLCSCWISSPEGLSRTMGQFVCYELMPLLQEYEEEHSVPHPMSQSTFFIAIYRMLQTNNRLVMMHRRQLKTLQASSPEDSLSLASLLSSSLNNLNDFIPQPLMSSICIEMDTVFSAWYHEDWPERYLEKKQEEIIPSLSLDNFQRKILPWENSSKQQVAARVKQDIILIASFVDKMPNLGGLARTSEIFAVKKMIVSSLRVKNDPVFKSTCVTADQWVDMEEVSEAQLPSYLAQMKREGYSLVGLEQTVNSKCLGKVAFPKKMILVLGKEKEGIPSSIIQMLDLCIEIPQFGIIRSLNVHVSGSILLWEYISSNPFLL